MMNWMNTAQIPLYMMAASTVVYVMDTASGNYASVGIPQARLARNPSLGFIRETLGPNV